MLSIIVPVYKVEEYLDRCVESLVGQSEENIEIILVDDGSPDKCPEMCDSWARKDDRIKVIHKPNGGLSDARNAGLSTARGEYVLFVDSDDYITENACRDLLSHKGADIIVGDLAPIGDSELLTNFSHPQGLLGRCLDGEDFLLESLKANRFPVPVCLNAYKRSFLTENSLSFKVGRLHEDEEFTPRAFLLAKSVIYTGVKFYCYILREDSITTNPEKSKNAEHIFKTCLELEKIYRSLDNKKLKRLLLNRLADMCLTTHRCWKLSRYGKEYIHKGFVLRCSKTFKIRLIAILYCISPVLFNKIF